MTKEKEQNKEQTIQWPKKNYNILVIGLSVLYFVLFLWSLDCLYFILYFFSSDWNVYFILYFFLSTENPMTKEKVQNKVHAIQ
jgi:hypothetical protein